MWPLSSLPIHKHAIKYALQKAFQRFLNLDDTALDDIQVRLTKGELQLRQVELRKEELSQYLQRFLTVKITSATVDNLNVALDAEFNSIELYGMNITLEPEDEEQEGGLYYDALEDGAVECGPSFIDQALLSGGTISPPFDHQDEEKVSWSLDRLFSTTFGEFTFKLLNSTISLVTPLINLTLEIPQMDIYRLAGMEKGFIDIPKGFVLQKANTIIESPLQLVDCASFNCCIEPNAGGVIMQNIANLRNVKTNLDYSSIEELGSLRQVLLHPWSIEKDHIPSKTEQQWEFTLTMYHFSLHYECFSLTLEKAKLSLPGRNGEICGICIESLPDGQFFDPITCDSAIFQYDALNAISSITLSQCQGEKLNIDGVPFLQKSVAKGTLNSTSPLASWFTFDTLVVNINSLNFREILVEKSRLQLDATRIELVKQKTGERFHAELLWLRDYEDFCEFKISKASFYRSYKLLARKGPKSIPWPFYEAYVMLNDHQYIPVQSPPEEYFLLRSKCIEQTTVHVHCSADEFLLRLGHHHDLISKLYFLVDNGSNNPKQQMTDHCLTLSLKSFKIQDDEWRINFKGKDVDMLSWVVGKDNYVFDLRMILEHASFHENGQDFKVATKILTASLDPHHRPVIFTLLKDGEERTLSAKLTGLLLSIPFEVPSFVRSCFSSIPKHSSQRENAIHRNFLQFETCSVEAILPSRFRKRMAPHVLYMGRSRLIFNTGNEALFYAFCETGEIMVAPGTDLVKMVDGLFSEGHVYWRERNYERVARYECIPVHINKLSTGRYVITIQNDTTVVDVHMDSIRVIRGIIKEYLRLIQDLRSVDMGEDVPSGEIDAKSILESLEESSTLNNVNNDNNAASGHDDSENEKANGFDAEEYTVIDLTGLIDEPLSVNETGDIDGIETFTISHGGWEEPSAQKQEMSDQNQDFKMKICLENFNLRIRLCEGELWSPDRPNHVLSLPNAISALDLGSSGRSSKSSSFMGVPVSTTASHTSTHNRYHSISRVSTSSESRWSHPAGTGYAHYKCPPDHVDLEIKGLEGDIFFTSPFPEDMVGAPSVTMTSLDLTIDDIAIVDHVANSKWRTFLGRFLNTKEKSTMLEMIHLTMAATFIPQPGSRLLPEEQLEWAIRLNVLPLRMHIDQDTLLFLLQFSTALGHLEPTIDSEETGPIFFIQKFRLMSDLYIRIDYKPKKVDLKRILGGYSVEMINLFAFEDAELQLPAVNLTGILLNDLPSRILRAWLPYVRNKQVSGLASGITTIKAVRTVGSGVNDLLILPLKQYRRGDKVFKGLKKGIRSFLRGTSLEGLKLSAKVASGTNQLLKHSEDVLLGDTNGAPPSIKSHPASFFEGLNNALETLKEGAKEARTIIAVPIQVYERDGTTGAIKSVVRAIPILALRSLIGLSGATHQTIQGMRHLTEVGRARAVRQKYKKNNDYEEGSLEGLIEEGELIEGYDTGE